MNNNVIVVGQGMAGLIAAINLSLAGKKVSILSMGKGVVAIGSSVVDFLGYVNKKRISDNPFNHLKELNSNHPYNIVGEDIIKESFSQFVEILNKEGLEYKYNSDYTNRYAISVMGTIKPTFITSEASDASILKDSKKVLFIGIEHIKDSQPLLAVEQFKNSKIFPNREAGYAYIKNPIENAHRVQNALDLSRYTDTDAGFHWLKSELLRVQEDYDTIILPPILGVSNFTKNYKELKRIGLNILECISMPPGVGGKRIEEALLSYARSLNITLVENCNVRRANVEGNKCISLMSNPGVHEGDRDTVFSASNYIIATGGVMGGGISSTPNDVYESIFNISIDHSERVEDRANQMFIGDHEFAKYGVSVNKDLKAINREENVILNNVYFAGNTLAGYDFPTEKSGYGVAISTGYAAAKNLLNNLVGE